MGQEEESVLTADMLLKAMRHMQRESIVYTDYATGTTSPYWWPKTVGVPSAEDNVPRDWLSTTGTLTDWFEDCSASAAMGLSSPVVLEIERTSSGELLITWTTLRPSES